MFNVSPKSVTLHTPKGSIRVKRVKDHIAYDEYGNPIDANKFKPARQLILGGDQEFELSNNVQTAEEYQRLKSEDLDWIKNNSVAWELYKKYH